MKLQPRLPDPDAEDLPQELEALGQKIAAVTGPHHAELEVAFAQVVEAIRRRRKILSLVQEALSQLRLDIKYLMFDLEVTREERDELRRQVEG